MNRAVLRLLMACLAAVVALSTTGLSAAQAATSTAYGSVYDRDFNEPINGATIKVYADQDSAWSEANPPVASATTAADGTYDITLEEGTYWARIKAPGYSQSIEPVVVDSTSPALDRSYLSPVLGTAKGNIVDHDGLPYTTGCATIQFYDATGDGETPTFGTEARDDGTYERKLRVGTWKVRAFDDCDDKIGAVWAGGTEFADAATITVNSDGDVAVPVIKLSVGASIRGYVTDAQGHTLKGILVETFSSDPAPFAGDPISRTYTGADGSYVLRGHQPGNYAIRFTDPVHEFVSGWYDGSNGTVGTFDEAGKSPVTDDSDVHVSGATLTAVAPDGRVKVLTGKVTDVNGVPLAGITVDAYGQQLVSTITRRDGTYSFVADELPPTAGPYLLRFRDEVGDAPEGQSRFIDQFYAGTTSIYRATEVTVTSTLQTLKTVSMVGYGSISGSVVVPSELQDSETEVGVYNRDDELVAQVGTKGDGTYVLPRLVPGPYKLRFTGEGRDGGNLQELIGQWYKGKYTFATASTVTVKDLGSTAGVNVTMTYTLTALSAPKVSGTARKGRTLKATTGTWNRVTDVEYTYHWYRGSSTISGARKSSYKLSSKDVGKRIKVKVTARTASDAFRSDASTSAATRTVTK